MSSGFISEAEIAERRRIRQEQWDKVRKPGQPEECPEEEYDPRSLFDRLQEQKQKREIEYEEAHKLKNMIKGLDDDEVEFLDLVDRTKLEAERIKSQEEAREIKDFRDAVARQQERSLEDRITAEIRARPTQAQQSAASTRSRNSQAALLTGAVRKRRAPSPSPPSPPPQPQPQDITDEVTPTEANNEVTDNSNGLRCIGILPGLGVYPDSSDSEQSSDTDGELVGSGSYDLLGRKIESRKVVQQQQDQVTQGREASATTASDDDDVGMVRSGWSDSDSNWSD